MRNKTKCVELHSNATRYREPSANQAKYIRATPYTVKKQQIHQHGHKCNEKRRHCCQIQPKPDEYTRTLPNTFKYALHLDTLKYIQTQLDTSKEPTNYTHLTKDTPEQGRMHSNTVTKDENIAAKKHPNTAEYTTVFTNTQMYQLQSHNSSFNQVRANIVNSLFELSPSYYDCCPTV